MKISDIVKLIKGENGTEVILASEIATEPTRVPPQYISMPIPEIMDSNPKTGLTNIIEDKDGFMRRYFVFLPLAHEKDTWYPTIAMQTVYSYLDLPNDIVPITNIKKQKIS